MDSPSEHFSEQELGGWPRSGQPKRRAPEIIRVTIEFTPEQARQFIHSDLEVSPQQARECVITLINDETPGLSLK